MEKILDIVELIGYEKNLPNDIVIDVIKEAMIKMANESLGEASYSVQEDKKERTLRLLYEQELVSDDDIRASGEEKMRYITLSAASKELGESLGSEHIGEMMQAELTLENMNRGAVNKLYLDLEHLLQKKIEERLYERFVKFENKLVNGKVVGVNGREDTDVELEEEVRAILPFKSRIKGEKFKKGDTIVAVLTHISLDERYGVRLRLSRTTPRLLEELLTLEVPEIKDGEVEIKRSARIPGVRAKVALLSHNLRIDPIGSTVGVKGVRINAVSRELCNENIDCIEFSEIDEIFITKALAPAKVLSVKITDKENKLATITLLADQKAKAIGKGGINISLASMLTGYKLELEELEAKGTGEGLSALEEAVLDEQEKVAEDKLGVDALEALFGKKED